MTVTTTELCRMSARELAAAVRAKQASSRDTGWAAADS